MESVYWDAPRGSWKLLGRVANSFHYALGIPRQGLKIKTDPVDYNGFVNACTGDGPLTREELEKVRDRLRGMDDAQLVHHYASCLHMCEVDRNGPPRAAYIQQLVQAWRELTRRKDSGSL
jgi:hypothetical protein